MSGFYSYAPNALGRTGRIIYRYEITHPNSSFILVMETRKVYLIGIDHSYNVIGMYQTQLVLCQTHWR